MVEYLVVAILGGAGGALGGLLGALIDRRRRGGATPDARRSWTLVLAILVGTLAINYPGLRERIVEHLDPPSPWERFGRHVLSLAGVKARIHGKEPGEVSAIIQQLVAAGVTRLDDAHLVERARLMAALMLDADAATCGAIGLGRLGRDDFRVAVERQPAGATEQWLRLMRDAVHAELVRKPARELSEAEVSGALTAVKTTLPAADVTRLEAYITALAAGPAVPAEACWAGRVLFGGVAGLPEPHRANLARLLAQP